MWGCNIEHDWISAYNLTREISSLKIETSPNKHNSLKNLNTQRGKDPTIANLI